nr:LysR family transcriptional regulator [Bradyrhizobium sp. 149]
MRFHSPAIQYFHAVRRTGSIRAAARVLNVASSAVSRQILKLEQEVGSPLFERSARGLTLTTVGEMLARHVMNVLQTSTASARTSRLCREPGTAPSASPASSRSRSRCCRT